MKNLVFLLTYIFFIKSSLSFSQTNTTTKQDTLYYLVDTARISVNDRVLEIKDAPLFKFYYFNCQCLFKGQIPYLIHRTNVKGEFVSPLKIKKFAIISTKKLLYLFHQNYYGFDKQYTTYILEVLPDKRVIKHLVTTGAITMSSDDLELIHK